MGASYQSRTLPACDVAELKKHVERICQMVRDASPRYGWRHTWGTKLGEGVEVMTNTFTSSAQAEEYVTAEADKYGPLIAVKLKLPDKRISRKVDAKIESITKKLAPLTFEYNGTIETRLSNVAGMIDLVTKIRANIKPITAVVKARAGEDKSGLRKCGHCKSTINLAFTHSIRCPVCDDLNLLYTPEERRRSASLRKKIDALVEQRGQLEIERATLLRESAIASDSWLWYVGGWCAG